VSVTLIEGCAIATVDDGRREYADGHLVLDGARIAAVGPGAAPGAWRARADRRIAGGGRLATPGLVNCHHHLYQWATRGYAQEATLFEWLVALYPVWQHIDAGVVDAAARAGLAALARSGCTTSTDHHYIFPRRGEDLLAVEIEAARAIGLRFHPCRGAMDLGATAGGLPPDAIVEDRDTILAASAAAIDRFHDPAPGAMVRIALAPTSPFSVTPQLMAETAALARARGVRLHTHLAETDDEDRFCLERFGVRPLQYLDDLGWLGDDVWLAHCVHLDDADIKRMSSTRTAVAWCPTSNMRLGSGFAPAREMIDAGVQVGLAVDGSASNDSGNLLAEARQAMLTTRARKGAASMSARQSLRVATRGGAACLGRDDIGSLEVGKRADIALFATDGLAFRGAEADPVAALVFCNPGPVQHLFVEGKPVVHDGQLVNLSEATMIWA
jgi:cytosine/adenosine deaminase-related metal-dependent hydrolase